MALHQLHRELAVQAQENPAGYIATESLARFIIGRLADQIAVLKGMRLIAGAGVLGAEVLDVVWSGAPSASLTPPQKPGSPIPEVDVAFSQSLTASVGLHISGEPSKRISVVSMVLDDIRVRLRARDSSLFLEDAQYEQALTIARTSDADALLRDAGIDEMEAAWVEGQVGYGAVPSALNAVLSEQVEISLADLFPAVDFGGAIKLEILANGQHLGIVPTASVELRESARCDCSRGIPLQLDQTRITPTPPPNPKEGDTLAEVVLGGPVPDNKDPHQDFGRRLASTIGEAGLYIPQRFAESLVVDVFPAVKVQTKGRGVIQYDAGSTVAFKNARVSFDQSGGGVILNLDMDISADASVWIWVLCTRLWVGSARMIQVGSQASLEMGFYPSVDDDGVVRLKSTLKNLAMGKHIVHVFGIGSGLSIFGIGAFVGFLVDTVLGIILTARIPKKLKKKISEYLTSREWELIDGVPVMDESSAWYPAAAYDVGPDSLLASVTKDG